MNLLIVATLISLSSAALLPSNTYIPPHLGSQGGFDGGSAQSSHLHGAGFGGAGNTRPQQNAEKHAAVLQQEQEVNEDGSYHFSYETSNGIRAEEAGNPAHAQGGFAYQGDDGHTYKVTYTSGTGGFVAQGDHLPVPPPTPQAILEALKQNERDEAAGIFDDGKYHPDVHGGGHVGHGQFGSNQGFVSGSSTSSHQGTFNPNTGYNY